MTEQTRPPGAGRPLPQAGETLPERQHRPDNVQLFLYNAALWNAHRIHFDAPYATGVEGYPGLVIAGPLIGDWLHQAVEEWLGDAGRLVAIEYSNRIAAFIGETLTSGGTVTAVDAASREVQVDVFVNNEAGDSIAPGVATVVWGGD
jgi:hydroxyacyl-ACP dehydratase HTD2-like protein with hotdog domain